MATYDKGEKSETDADAGSPAGRLSAAAKQAQRAMESAKDLVAGADLDGLGHKAADAASAVYRSGRDLVANSEELSQAKAQLSDAIRKNPLAAIGIAFTAGLVFALLTRG